MAEVRMNLPQAVQIRAEEATNKVIIIDQDLENLKAADQDLRRGLDAKIAEIEQAFMDHKDRGGGRNGDRGKSLMDPKNMTVSRFEGKKADFEKWRTEIENYLACFYKDIDKVLPFMRRCELPVNSRHLAMAIDQTEDVQLVEWDFKDVEDDGGKWIISKLGSDALYMSSSAGKGFWSIYAYLNQEYDELGVQTESLLQASFLSLVQNPAKTLAETKMRMVLFEKKAKEFREKIGRDIELSLKRSVFITIIDPETKRDFVKQSILDDYREMRKQLSALLCNGLTGGSGPVPMDLNAMWPQNDDTAEDEMGCRLCPVQPWQPGSSWQPKKFACWNCDAEDHSAANCPLPLKPEVAARLQKKGGSKGGKSKGDSKGGWNNNKGQSNKGTKGGSFKGFGKGGNGKGKGLRSLNPMEETMTPEQYAEWYNWEGQGQTSPQVPLKSMKVKSFNSIKWLPDEPVETHNSFSALDESDHDDSISDDEAVIRAANDPVYQTIPGTAGRMRATMGEARLRREDNDKIIRGEKPRGSQDPEWLRMHQKVRAMMEGRPCHEDDFPPLQAALEHATPTEPPPMPPPSYPPPQEHAVEAPEVRTQSGKNVKPSLRPLKTKKDNSVKLNGLKNLDAHTKLMSCKPEEWTEIRLTVDSGAGETVVPPSEAPNVLTVEGDRKGCRYEVANGEVIRNLGVKQCSVVTNDGGVPKNINLQVADVHKGLLSVIELVKSGHRVVFDDEWSFIEDKDSGWRDTIDQKEDEFELVAWVKAAQGTHSGPDKPDSGTTNKPVFGRPAR